MQPLFCMSPVKTPQSVHMSAISSNLRPSSKLPLGKLETVAEEGTGEAGYVMDQSLVRLHFRLISWGCELEPALPCSWSPLCVRSVAASCRGARDVFVAAPSSVLHCAAEFAEHPPPRELGHLTSL